jgi:6-phosphogluconolactonase
MAAEPVHQPDPAAFARRRAAAPMSQNAGERAAGGRKVKTPRSGATSLALALLFAIGATSISAAKTFVYVSNAQDGNIDAYIMDTGTGALTPIGKAEAGKLVMPMTVSPNKKHVYAVVRLPPPRVLTYVIDPVTGALTQKASAPLPDSMPYVSTDRTGRYLFTASYGGDKLAVSPIGENGLIEADAIQVIPTGRHAHSILPDRSNRFVYAALLGG